MSLRTTTSFLVTCAGILLLTASCSRYSVCRRPTVSKGNGPPAHAPAHGHRRKHVSGVELIFDSGRGVYVVVGFPDHYYYDGYFFRLRGDLWEMSPEPNGKWKAASHSSLPIGLQARIKTNGNGNGNGKGKGKGKHKKDVVTIGRLF